MYLDELSNKLFITHDIRLSADTIANILFNNGFTKKKLQRNALERDVQAGVDFMQMMNDNYTPDQLVDARYTGKNDRKMTSELMAGLTNLIARWDLSASIEEKRTL